MPIPIAPASNLVQSTLTLLVSADGRHWHRTEFTDTTIDAVDRHAATYVITYRDQLQITAELGTNWSALPATWHALSRITLPSYATATTTAY